MNNQKFAEKKDILEKTKHICEEKREDILQFYCDCLIKMYKAYYKIEETEMLSYVKQIMAPAFPLVVDYFVEMVDACLNSESDMDKARMRQDIEESVVNFSQVFEEIIHSTNGADRMLVQTAPIDIGIRYAAPKLCAYYTSILNSMAQIFEKPGEKKYAFCVYPTQISCAEAVLLFSTMNKSGKVCIIRVPGHKIAHIQYLRQLLMHEFFHVLPSSLRLRKKRASALLYVCLNGISSEMFQGCSLSSEERERLRIMLFAEVKTKIKSELKGKEELDRIYYSKNIHDLYVKILQKQMYRIQGKSVDDFEKQLENEEKHCTYEAYHNHKERARTIFSLVRANVQYTSLDLTEKCRYYMDLFREVYADVLSVITLRLQVRSYFGGFQYSPTKENEQHIRSGLYFRVMFVAGTLAEEYSDLTDEQEKMLEDWKKWRDYVTDDDVGEFVKQTVELEKIYLEGGEKEKGLSRAVTTGGEDDEMKEKPNNMVVLNCEMRKKYMDYFHECCQQYLEYENQPSKCKKFDAFREKFDISLQNDVDAFNYSIGARHWEM